MVSRCADAFYGARGVVCIHQHPIRKVPHRRMPCQALPHLPRRWSHPFCSQVRLVVPDGAEAGMLLTFQVPKEKKKKSAPVNEPEQTAIVRIQSRVRGYATRKSVSIGILPAGSPLLSRRARLGNSPPVVGVEHLHYRQHSLPAHRWLCRRLRPRWRSRRLPNTLARKFRTPNWRL